MLRQPHAAAARVVAPLVRFGINQPAGCNMTAITVGSAAKLQFCCRVMYNSSKSMQQKHSNSPRQESVLVAACLW
jgi:hypothetical protein